MGIVVGDASEHGHGHHASVEARIGEGAQGAEPHLGRRGDGFELAGERAIHRRQGDADRDGYTGAELTQKVQVAADKAGLGEDAQGEVGVAPQHLQDAPRDLELSLGGLPRIGGTAEENGASDQVAVGHRLGEDTRRVVLDEDAPLEIARVVEIEERVSVAREAIDTPELTAAIGVKGPEERTVRLEVLLLRTVRHSRSS